ncbi:MAG: SMP-30/gluconolactonase/LRE family protein [Acidobacteria bacterium]|nr:SMP-30/gluconolactonase/LRE family protein [Acidobacteriota bacterium]
MRAYLFAPVLLLFGCAEKPPTAPAAAPLPSEPDVTIATSVAFTEGPAQGPDGMLYFTDVANNRILRFNPRTKKHDVYRADSNRANGLLFDAQGRLIACEGSDGERNKPRVTRTDLMTGKVEELATQFEGKNFNAPNDVTIDSKGRLYFTDPAPDSTSPVAKAAGATGVPGVYRIDTDGKVARILTAPDTEWPNGLVISPDDKTFYLIEANKVEGGTRAIRAYDLSPDGTLSNRRVHYNYYPGRSADGMAIDVEGNIYAAAGLHRPRGTKETLDTKCGVYVISPQGKLLRFLPVPEDTITNTAFGGAENKTLYITAGKTLFQAPNAIAGMNR